MPTKNKTKPAARSAEPKPATPEPEPTPEWVNETPDDNDYQLIMYAWDGDNPQSLHMTRREFITLKRCLAALRGYPLAAPREHFEYSTGQYVLNVLVANLRQRLQQGAPTNVGKWRLSDDGSEIEAHRISGIGINGLDIDEVKEIAASVASANQ
jgi:hypothetical protein